MYNNNSIHYKFIKTPLLDILKDGVNACRGVGCVMDAYPLTEYILQSIFLRMTGAQEQKLKCICWDMATNDFSYRNTYLRNVKNDYGEFSKYDHKNNVYLQLIEEIYMLNKNFNIDSLVWIEDIDEASKNQLFLAEVKSESERLLSKELKKNNTLTEQNKDDLRKNIEQKYNNNKETVIIKGIKRKFVVDIKNMILQLMDLSILSVGNKFKYSYFKNDTCLINSHNCATKENLLTNKLQELYCEDVIRHRHRCAHNLTSYQQHLPSLETLAMENSKYHTYYFRFAILILIDEIFMRLYEEYVKCINNKIRY